MRIDSSLDGMLHYPHIPLGGDMRRRKMDHVHVDRKKVLNRMARVIGHMEAVKGMIAEDRDCSDVLIQIAAIRSAVTNIGKIIMQDHLSHCIVAAVEEGDAQAVQKLSDAIDAFIK